MTEVPPGRMVWELLFFGLLLAESSYGVPPGRFGPAHPSIEWTPRQGDRPHDGRHYAMSTRASATLDEAARVFYRRSLALLHDAGVPFMVGGAYAFAHYTGV